MLIPTNLISVINNYVSSDYNLVNLPETKKQLFVKKLIELWYFIYNRQISVIDFVNLKFFVDIREKELEKFNIQIQGKRLVSQDLISILKDCNLIDINNSYKIGFFPISYRIKTEFIGSDYSEIDIDFDKIFSNTKTKKYWISKLPEYKSLIENCYKARIDLGKYFEFLQSNIGMELKPVFYNGHLKNRTLTEERILHYITLSLKVNLGNLWFKLSDEGRFYSSISNLPYTSVPFIKLRNQKTVEIDMKNSQPLLLSVLVDNDDYKKDVIDGVFYDKMAVDLNMTRNQFKIYSYKYIFFSSKELKSGKIYDAIENRYKGLIHQINNIKKSESLSRKLQTMESDIFVNKIRHLDIPVLIRHDQIITQECYMDEIKMYLKCEYNRLGLEGINL